MAEERTSYREINEAVVDCDGDVEEGGEDEERVEIDDWRKKTADAMEVAVGEEEKPIPFAALVESLCCERRTMKTRIASKSRSMRSRRTNRARDRDDYVVTVVVATVDLDCP